MATKITKQQLADKLREAETVLVTTDASPSISQLSAGLGLVGILEEMDKSALFVYDGEVSPALDFLKPAEAISADAESLRDFIISFDTSKVDKFRYTQEDNQYNILLTPGRKQVINEEDIRYHKGDFNIDLVLALGVSSRSSICQAVGQHAQLMEGLPMVNILTDNQRSSLETEFWQSDTVCSLGEMIYDLSQVMEDNYRLDRQVANALLTSIVEHTERFKNKHTQADTMHISGELIRCGADPSLVAESLAGHTFQEEEQEIMELEEIVQSADVESGDKVQAEAAEKETAKKAKRKRMYMREGDVDANFSIGKRAEVRKGKQQQKEHKISQVKIDAHGNIQISAEADAKEASQAEAETAEAAKPAVAEAEVADATPAAAPSTSPEDLTPSVVASDAKAEEPAPAAPADREAMAPAASAGGRVLQPLSPIDAPASEAAAPPIPAPTPVPEPAGSLAPSPEMTAPSIAQMAQAQAEPTEPYSPEALNQKVDALGAAKAGTPLNNNQYIDALTNPLNSMPSVAASDAKAEEPAPAAPAAAQAMTVDNYLAQAPTAPAGQTPPVAPPLPAQALNQPSAPQADAAPPAAPPLASMT